VTNNEILSKVDHTLLSAASSWKDIQKLCDEAIEYNTASVCVPASYVKKIANSFPGLNICTVIGFPLGYSTTTVKCNEAQNAISDGANEIDMVINLGDVKNGDFDKVTAEIHRIKDICGGKTLKVIIETCYLTTDEKVALCSCVTNGGADFIKTSTGFGPAGATMDDILLFKKHIGSNVSIKAAGGIRSREDMVGYIEAGCSRLGTSSAIKILCGEAGAGY